MTQTKPSPIRAASSRRVLVIHNPVAGKGGGRGRLLNAVLERLRFEGCVVTLRETSCRGDAEHMARNAASGGWDVIAVAGGDGTINEVVNGVVAVGGGLPVAVIPLGTANVLALEIGVDPKDPEAIAETIAYGPRRNVHLGLVNGRHFVLMAGAGLDAHVVAGVNGALKRHAGKFAYVVESLRQAFGYDFPALTIRANGETYEGSMAVACKGRFYGGPFVAAPDASLDSPKLELCILPKSGMRGLMRYGFALPLNKLPSLPEIRMVSADSITILGPRGAPLQGDGDIVARLPAEISVSPERLTLIVPE